MPEVAFHTGLADKIGYTCRLLRKASRQGWRVRVVGDATEIDLLDKALWTFDAHEFLPHVRLTAGAVVPAALHRTSVWLTTQSSPWPAGLDAAQVLVNLGPAVPQDAATFERLFDLVADDSAESAAGRRRWREYGALGLTLKHLPAAEQGAAPNGAGTAED